MGTLIEKIPSMLTHKTPEARAGVIIAGFSKEWKEGKWDQFDRIPIKKGHAWALKSLGLPKKLIEGRTNRKPTSRRGAKR